MKSSYYIVALMVALSAIDALWLDIPDLTLKGTILTAAFFICQAIESLNDKG